MAQNKVLIIDFGSQLTQVIARRIREIGVYTEIKSSNISKEEISTYKAIILSGGSMSVYDQNAPQISPFVFESGIPVMGICYGQQIMCHHFGGIVERGNVREFGRAHISVLENDTLFDQCYDVQGKYQVWMSHSDLISKLPDKFKALAQSEHSPYAIIKHESRDLYGLQFHPEAFHTPDGVSLLRNFVINIAKCDRDWSMGQFLHNQITSIKSHIGTNKVACAVSGGVDSTVVAKILHEAIGNNLHCIFINNGLLRHNEHIEVKETLEQKLGLQIHCVDASDQFLSALKGITDPERKRKIIGKTFIDVFQEKISSIGNISHLAQGTIYPDIIESSSTIGAAAIKSHHNVGGLPKNMYGLKIIEPIKNLFKDEVRQLGKELGIDEHFLKRHPFPGPGLAIRIIGEITKGKCDLLRQIDHIYIQALKQWKLYDNVWQAYAALLPIQSVGVMGDGRTYQSACSLRAVTSTDGMTADFVDLPHAFLSEVTSKIINNVHGVNRVFYDITSKPPSTIELE